MPLLQRPPRTAISLVIIVLLFFGYHHLSVTIEQSKPVYVPHLSDQAESATKDESLDGSIVDFDEPFHQPPTPDWPAEWPAEIPPELPTESPVELPTEHPTGFPTQLPSVSTSGSPAESSPALSTEWPAPGSEAVPTSPSAQLPTQPSNQSSTTQPLSKVKGALVKDAHKLRSADDFLPHLKAVTELPGMTMAEAKAPCNWPVLSEVNFQYADNEWVKKDRNDSELEYRRKQWQDFIANELVPYASYMERFHGRGIVIVAGNQRSMKRVRVILRQLKKLGSQMPIEIHYWDDELNEEQQKDIASMWPNMYFNDLSASTNILKTNHNGFYINYQLKTAAVMNSRFAEPLLLDSDNIPIVDPASLYESDTYKEYGTLFWPDIARTRPNNPMWAITNTACRKDEYEQESGQLIVDKRRFFYHLQLAAWYNNVHADYYNEFLLGDKDMFRFSWHALQTKYGFPPKWITSVGTLTPSPKDPKDLFYCGHTFAQHHPNGSVAFLHGGLVKTMTKEVMKWQRESHGGIFQVYKRSEYDEHHIVNVNTGIKWDPADYLPNKPEDLRAASCTDYYDVEPRPLDEIVPGFQKTFEDIGGYWMLDG